MLKYVAYGALIASDLDLSHWLQKGETGRHSLVLKRISESARRQALELCTPMFSTHGRELTILTDREFMLSVKGQPWCFEVEDVVRFFWFGSDGLIEYEALEQCTEQLLAFWAIHIFLPLYFTLEGMYEFIHACAVEVAGESILFTAPSHGGKSTLTDFFLTKGHTLISDDKVASYREDGIYYAMPSHPNHRPYRKFEDLGYHLDEFSIQAKPVDAIYSLQSVEPESEVAISEISGHRKFAQMLPSYLFNFSFMKAARMKYLADMADAMSIYRVEVPWEQERLEEVHDAICEHRLGMKNCGTFL